MDRNGTHTHAPSAQVNPNIGASVIALDHSPRVKYKFVNKNNQYYFHEVNIDTNNGKILSGC